MTNPPENQSNTNDTHVKNRIDLKITKQELQKELDSIIDLVGLEKKDNNFANTSNFQSQANISQKDFIDMLESNRKLQSDIKALSDSIENLKNEINTLRENIRILKAEQPNVSLIEAQIYELKDSIRNLENFNLPQSKYITEEIPEETIVYDEPIQVESNVQYESELSDEENDPKNEKIIQETRRRRCPTCNNGNQRYIRELVDKTNIIMQSPRIYGKIYKCGICTTEWK